MKTKLNRNKPQTRTSGRLEERDGNLWIVLETPFNGSGCLHPKSGLRQWFRIEAPDAISAMLAGRPVRQFDPEQGLFIDEEGNSYEFFHNSFREFVTARVGGRVREYHRRWAEHGLGEWRNLHSHAAVYALRHLPRHLIEASRRI